ncbi:MAG: tetratricopeptide repeat protein, partial [Thermomicrobiales bacterium]|nr:tetratricopeptide repeat protein [Thermomicrobiales bacterium]
AAYRPDLAMSLNNLAVRLAEVGDRKGALAPAQEAVNIRRELAKTAPAAYRPDLAGSLNNLAALQSDVKDGWRRVNDEYDRAISMISPGPGAVLLVHRTRWHAWEGRVHEAEQDIRSARELAEQEHDTTLAASARGAVRSVVTEHPQFTDAAGSGWPSAPLPDNAMTIMQAWLSADRWAAHEEVLDRIDPQDSKFRAHLDLARFVYPNVTGLDMLSETLDDIAGRSAAVVYDEHRSAERHAGLVGEWLDTPTWAASLEFARKHPEAISEQTLQLLEGARQQSNILRQHQAIVQLGLTWEISEVYDAIEDPEFAADRALASLLNGDTETAILLATLSPALVQTPFTGRFVIATLGVLAGDISIESAEVLTGLALNGTAVERNKGQKCLSQLVTANPEHAEEFQRLTGTFNHASLVREWIDTPTWTESYEFTRQHPEILSEPRTLDLLANHGHKPVFIQHAAIIMLARTMNPVDVFKIAADPKFAAEYARRSDSDTTRLILLASPDAHELITQIDDE